MTAAPGGGYTVRTGTSIAVPFVTGSAALMMEWGIVQGNDPYLYGEKVKAYLIKGARRLPGAGKGSRQKGRLGSIMLIRQPAAKVALRICELINVRP